MTDRNIDRQIDRQIDRYIEMQYVVQTRKEIHDISNLVS